MTLAVGLEGAYVLVPSVFGENIPTAKFGMILTETACFLMRTFTCHSTFLFGRKPFLILRPMPFLYTTICMGEISPSYFTTVIRTGGGGEVLEIGIWRITEQYRIAKWLYKGLAGNCRSFWCC